MEKDIIIRMINENLSQRKIAKELNISQCKVAYWMNKYKIKSKYLPYNKGINKPKECKCGEKDENNFYKNKRYICKKCFNKDRTNWTRNNKKYGVDILGGKCIVCSYKKHFGSLDFHHLNPNIKDKNFRSLKFWSKDRIDKELYGCVLLCKNCHQEYHDGIIDILKYLSGEKIIIYKKYLKIK